MIKRCRPGHVLWNKTDVKSNIRRIKITNWKDRISEWTKLKTLVEKAKASLKL